MPVQGIYLYCILGKIRKNETFLLSEGIDPAFPFEVICYRDIGAAVSTVWLSEFGEDGLHNNIRNNIDWVEEKARSHTLILEQISEQYSTAPVKFCTIFNDRKPILQLLAEKYKELSHVMEAVEGKKEWTVKVFCQKETYYKQVENEKKEKLESALQRRSPGAAYLLKKKFNETVKLAFEKALSERVNGIYRLLQNYAEDIVLEVCLNSNDNESSRKMVLKCSLLISGENVQGFLMKMNETNESSNPDGLFLEITGPWPPYSFTVVNLQNDNC